MKSSFQLGGQGIEMLATDPLLPKEMLDTEPRVSLMRLMREYDRIGREIWLGAQITQDSDQGMTT